MELQFTEIENIVTNHLDIDLKKNTRAYPYPMSRFMYFKLCRKYGPKIEVKNKKTTYSSKKHYNPPTMASIAKTMNKHHCTVVHAIKTIENILEVDKKFAKIYVELEKIILDKINNVNNESSTIRYKSEYI